MRLYLTDFPHHIPIQYYDNAKDYIVDILRKYESVESIFQVGNISDPGISDIDIMVVFRDGSFCPDNPLKEMSKSEKYFFLHNLYGISEKYFSEAESYSFFENYILLWGKQSPIRNPSYPSQEILTLKVQIALEYLVKMYINLSVAMTYRIIRVRQFMLQCKALLKDLEFMDVYSGPLFDLLQVMVQWRRSWFNSSPVTKDFEKWIVQFYEELSNFLIDALEKWQLYIPNSASLKISRNMNIVPSKKLFYRHTGFPFPTRLGCTGRRYFNLQNRYNWFKFMVPFLSDFVPELVLKRNKFISSLISHNSYHFKYFVPLAFGLSIFEKN